MNKIKYGIYPIPQRGDLLIEFKEVPNKSNDSSELALQGINFWKFLDLYSKILKLLSNRKMPVVATETEFFWDTALLDKPKECTTKFQSRRITLKREQMEILKWLRSEKILAEHTQTSYTNLLIYSTYFEKHIFLKFIIVPFLETIKNLNKKIKKIKREIHEYENIITEIETLTNLTIRETPVLYDLLLSCKSKINEFKFKILNTIDTILSYFPIYFKDRFRGNYPFAELASSSIMRYKGNFEKLFFVIEALCISAFRDISKRLKIRDKDFSILVFLSNEFSPFTHLLPLGRSMFLGISDFFIHEDFYYIFHELGHYFWRVYEEKCINKLDFEAISEGLMKDNRNIIEEIICDYFSLCVSFRGNLEFYEDRVRRNEHWWEEDEIRLIYTKWLFKNISKSTMSIRFPQVSSRFINCESLNKIFTLILNNPSFYSLKKKLIQLKRYRRYFFSAPPDLFSQGNWIEKYVKLFKSIR
jgi:hypothetical protein